MVIEGPPRARGHIDYATKTARDRRFRKMIKNTFLGNRKIKYTSAGPPTRLYSKSGAEKSAASGIRTTDLIRDLRNTFNKGVFALYISGLSPLLLQVTPDIVLQALFNVELGLHLCKKAI